MIYLSFRLSRSWGGSKQERVHSSFSFYASLRVEQALSQTLQLLRPGARLKMKWPWGKKMLSEEFLFIFFSIYIKPSLNPGYVVCPENVCAKTLSSQLFTHTSSQCFAVVTTRLSADKWVTKGWAPSRGGSWVGGNCWSLTNNMATTTWTNTG